MSLIVAIIAFAVACLLFGLLIYGLVVGLRHLGVLFLRLIGTLRAPRPARRTESEIVLQ